MKPRIFVGSSTEGLNVAYALQENLELDAEVTVWTQGIFQPSRYVLESLLNTLETSDFGVFVFSADDVAKIRGADTAVIRDNVIFELGLFVGRLGRDRSVFLIPRGAALHIPSDLLGVISASFEANRQDDNLRAAIGPAANNIRNLLKRLPKFEAPSELKLSFFQRRALLSPTQQKLLALIEAHQPCTEKFLLEQFHCNPDAELFYRTEQLRLLMFITRAKVESDFQYRLYDSYLEAYRALGPRVDTPAYSPPDVRATPRH